MNTERTNVVTDPLHKNDGKVHSESEALGGKSSTSSPCEMPTAQLNPNSQGSSSATSSQREQSSPTEQRSAPEGVGTKLDKLEPQPIVNRKVGLFSRLRTYMKTLQSVSLDAVSKTQSADSSVRIEGNPDSSSSSVSTTSILSKVENSDLSASGPKIKTNMFTETIQYPANSASSQGSRSARQNDSSRVPKLEDKFDSSIFTLIERVSSLPASSYHLSERILEKDSIYSDLCRPDLSLVKGVHVTSTSKSLSLGKTALHRVPNFPSSLTRSKEALVDYYTKQIVINRPEGFDETDMKRIWDAMIKLEACSPEELNEATIRRTGKIAYAKALEILDIRKAEKQRKEDMIEMEKEEEQQIVEALLTPKEKVWYHLTERPENETTSSNWTGSSKIPPTTAADVSSATDVDAPQEVETQEGTVDAKSGLRTEEISTVIPMQQQTTKNGPSSGADSVSCPAPLPEHSTVENPPFIHITQTPEMRQSM